MAGHTWARRRPLHCDYSWHQICVYFFVLYVRSTKQTPYKVSTIETLCSVYKVCTLLFDYVEHLYREM